MDEVQSPVQTPAWARAVERTLFGSLLGMVGTAAISRLVLLVSDLPTIVLIGLSAIGALIGGLFGLYAIQPAESLNSRLDHWHSWLRRIGLRAMLGLLGIAALLGVVTVLTGSYDVLGRVSGTVIATSIAAGFLWGSSALANRQSTQEAGLLGMASTLAVYLLVVPMIWEWGPRGEEVLSTALVVGLSTPVLMFFLAMKNVTQTWYAARIGFLMQLSAVAVFLVAAWHGTSWRQAEPWWETGWWTTLLAFFVFACLCGLKRIVFDWRWLGVVTSLVAWTLAMVPTWTDTVPDEKLMFFIASLAVTFAHTSFVMLAPLTSYQNWLRWLTVATAIGAMVLTNLEINLEPGGGLSLFGRSGAACLVVVACGSLALIVVATINRLSARHDTGPSEYAKEFGNIGVTCPHCECAIEAPIGRIVCPQCGLVMSIRIEARPEEQSATQPAAQPSTQEVDENAWSPGLS